MTTYLELWMRHGTSSHHLSCFECGEEVPNFGHLGMPDAFGTWAWIGERYDQKGTLIPPRQIWLCPDCSEVLIEKGTLYPGPRAEPILSPIPGFNGWYPAMSAEEIADMMDRETNAI